LSCTYRVKFTLPKTPIFKRYPLTIVLYQSQEFKSYTYPLDPSGTFSNSIDLGNPSGAILLETLKAMFDRVIPVDNISNTPNDYAGLLEPKIVGMHDISLSTKNGTVEITYGFTLYDKNKQIVTQFEVTGGDYSGFWIVSDATGPAMGDAMAQLMVKFQEDPKIREWLAANGVNQKQEN